MAFIEPSKVVSYFDLRPDTQVADFGCGTGAYALAMSRAILPNGKVYAIDVQRDLLVTLKNVAHEQNVRNIDFIWADAEKLGGTKIADGILDFVLLSNILFQTHGGYQLSLEAKRILKPGGQVAIIDWADSFGGLGPQMGDVVKPEEARKTFESAGFEFVKDFPAGDHHYGLIMKKK